VLELEEELCMEVPTSACVVATAWIWEMLYNLRTIHIDAAGIPTDAASVILVAARNHQLNKL